MDLNSLPSDSSDMQKKIQNHEINMFNVTKVERKMRETNLLVYQQISLRAELHTIIYCCLSSDCHANLLGIKIYHLHMQKIYGS